MAQHISAHIQIIAQNPEEKQRVKQYGDALGQIMNEVKAMMQRAQEAAQQQQGNGQPDPETMAKIQGTIITAQAKAQNTRESHAERTAQKKISWEIQMQQKMDEHRLEMQKAQMDLQKQAEQNKLDLIRAAKELQLEVTKNRLRSELPPEEKA